jgi:hypothetical protein
MSDPYKEPIDDKDKQDTIISPPASSVSQPPPLPPPAAPLQPPPLATPPAQMPPVTPLSPSPAPPAPPAPPGAPQPNFRPGAFREPIEAIPPAAVKIETPVAPQKIEKIEKEEKIVQMPPKAPLEQPVKPETVTPAQVVPPLPPIPETPPAADLNQDRQLKILIDLAFEQGIAKAIEAVNATGDAYLIDKFHDTLVDELRQQLVEKGKLKEV